ncbi:MAG: hypothetical protein KGO53_03920 [Alphaproteobacteria bacterium]|nr:hypothetical protein [Alphaproteobacteria bacterium]
MHPVNHLKHLTLALALGIAAANAATVAMAADSIYFGRWVVSDDKPAFSAKGKLYKTIDIAPCGADFCGVSVGDKGECGATLFRFLTIHANTELLTGHGLWGDAKMKLEINARPADSPDGAGFYLGLGDKDMDLTGREGSLPKFEANYKGAGDAKCVAGGHTS